MPHDQFGREIPDPTPVPHRSEETRLRNLTFNLQQFVQAELSRLAAARELETEEEANDFEDEDDPDVWTQYEEEDYRASEPPPAKQPEGQAAGPAPVGPAPSPASSPGEPPPAT